MTAYPCTVSGTAPWVLRVAEIKAATAVNVEAERKVAQLNDEMQALVRTLKAKDQHIQESGVKNELMERRMEGVKKQGELIEAAEEFVKEHFKNHDPSHDWYHVHRVRLMALSLSRCPSHTRAPDMLVLELAA